MFNYFEDLVWNINKILLALMALLIAIIAVYALIITYFENKRIRNLMRLKKNVHALALSGQKPTGETCPTVETGTAQRYLDIEMEREQVLFNDTEKQFIRKCFTSPEKVVSLKKIAKGSINKWRRIEALLSLGYSGDTSSLDIIKEAALNKDEDVAYYSLLSLGLIKNTESAKILLELLKKKAFSPSKIASILESFPPSIADEVAKLTDDADPATRFWAVDLLARLKAERYIKKIEQLTNDTAANVRVAACGCLGGFGKNESKAVLMKCLKDNSWVVRMNAVRSLSKFAGVEAMEDIVGMLNEDSLMVKESVKSAMAAHIEAALPYIGKILAGTDEVAKQEAVEALEISGYISKLLRNSISDDSKKKAEASDLLKAIVKAKAHFGIEAALDGMGKDQRERVVVVLRSIDSSFAEHVVKKIKHETTEI